MQANTYADIHPGAYNPLHTRFLPDLKETNLYHAPAEDRPRSASHSRLGRAFWRGVSSAVLALSLLAAPVRAVMPVQLGVGVAAHPTVSISQTLPSTGAPGGSRYFAVTGKTVHNDFLRVFNRYGLRSIGYPLSDERQENGLTVQYFERVRMERHPELASKGYGVLMTRLGDDLSKPNQPFAGAPTANSTGGGAFFKATGHTLSGPFLSYWKANGGVARFGYPISEPMQQNGLRVQWFERARFEYHPELANKGMSKSGGPVQLGLLGRAAYEKVAMRTTPASPAAPAKRSAPAAQQKEVPTTQASQPSLSSVESYLLKSVNEQRAAAGLGPVQLDGTLVEIARSRSGDMASRNYFSHTTPEGTNFLGMLNSRDFQYRYAGEILARNNYPDDEAASVAITSYLDSPPHKAIIMDGRYNLVGVGYARSGEDDMHYFAVIFAQR